MTKLRIEAAKLLKEYFDIEPETAYIMFDNGFLDEKRCRDALIRLEYEKKVQPKERLRLRQELAEKYSLSTSFIEKLVLYQL